MTVHLVGAESASLCAMKVPSAATSEVLAEVDCAVCLALADRLSTILTRARRNGTATYAAAPGQPVRKVLEEHGMDGSWKLHDLKRWLRAGDGEYAVTLRVRTIERKDSPVR